MKIIAIGTPSDLENKKFSGQSIMFDAIVAYFKSIDGNNVSVISINNVIKRKKKRAVSTFSFYRVFDYFIIALRLFKHLLIDRCDVIYMNVSQSKVGFLRDYLLVLVARLFRVKIVAHQFGAEESSLYGNLSSFMRRRYLSIYKYISQIVVEGEYMAKHFKEIDLLRNKVSVIPNGLPNYEMLEAQPKRYKKGETFNILWLSNLIYSKGYFDVIKAVDLLVNKYGRNIHCTFCGRFMTSSDDPKCEDVDFKTQFFDYINNHQLDAYIEYHEGVYGEEKSEIYKRSHVFVLPSYYFTEGQPISILEVMSRGIVPIVTKFRHIPMMVNEHCGFFVEPHSPEQIADAIMEMMDNKQLYSEKSKNSIDYCNDNFKFSFFAERLFNILKK